jgi:hypothetical protein
MVSQEFDAGEATTPSLAALLEELGLNIANIT